MGSGMSFDWEILADYNGPRSFFLSGGIGLDTLVSLGHFDHPFCIGYDLNSRFETAPGSKMYNSSKHSFNNCNMKTASYLETDELGFYGDFGGAYIPELLRENVEDLDRAFRSYCFTESFERDFTSLLNDYVGRPTPLYLGETFFRKIRLSRLFQARRFMPYRCA